MSSIPTLPRQKELMAELEPYHSKLVAENVSARRHPVHQTNEAQVQSPDLPLDIVYLYLSLTLLFLKVDKIITLPAPLMHIYLIQEFLFDMWSLLQANAVNGFLGVIYRYLESLCHNLRSHTITNVQSNNDKVCSWLLFCKDRSTYSGDYLLCYFESGKLPALHPLSWTDILSALGHCPL